MTIWYEGLILRNLKLITSKGLLFSKLFANFRLSPENVSKITIKDLVNAADLNEARFKAFTEGQFEDMPDEIFAKLLASIKMPLDSFKAFAKKSAIVGVGMFAKDVYAEIAPPVITPATVAPETVVPLTTTPTGSAMSAKLTIPTLTPKQETPLPEKPKASKMITIENYLEEPLIIMYSEKDNRFEIHPNYAEGKAKASTQGMKSMLLSNAVVFGNRVIAGKVVSE